MAAPICRGKLLEVICTKTIQVQHRSLPWTLKLKPGQFFCTSSSSFPRLSSFDNEATSNRTPLQGSNMLWRGRRNITTLKFDHVKTYAIGCCSFSSSASTNDSKTFAIGCRGFSSSASTNDDDQSSSRPHAEVKLPTSVKIKTLDTVGQRIRPGTIHLLDHEGKSMGALHSFQALKRVNDPENSGVRLVLIDADAKPYPAYQLMTPQQLLEERAKLREEKKANKGVGTVQTMRFSSDITKHDLSHKLHKIDSFIEKKSLVKISISNPRNSKKTTEDMVKLADNILKSLTAKAVYQTPPTLKGTSVNCVLRPMSDKDASTSKKK